MNTPVTFSLPVELAVRFNKFLYKNQLRKGKLISGLITKYLDENDNTFEENEINSVKPEKFN